MEKALSISFLDRGGVGAVAETEEGGEDEEGLDAEDFPYPAAQKGDEDGDGVVDGNACRDGGAHSTLEIVGL